MTRDEHITRAALLGRVYNKEINVYEYAWRENTHRCVGALDAKTLEELTGNEWWVRFINYSNEGDGYG